MASDPADDRWRRAEAAFHAAVARPPASRAAALREICGGDAALEADVESLLRFHHAPPGALDAPPPDVAVRPPARVGSYRVLSVLGEGGMGTVFLAEQENPRRTVALKRIRAGLSSRDALRRFEREALFLGRLSHPGIAQIFEAGTADTGLGPQPYFAMELVAGKPLASWADARGLGARERIAIVARVADAVQHAHGRGVIHCDLKPGNVLVDETGQPKILDFGVARASAPDDEAATIRPEAERSITGTLAYMSPEQCAGDAARIDERSDVYALGAIAYELLAGRPPISVSGLPLAEAARRIRDEEPRRLSAIDRALRGDVETIVAKAIEKDLERRYASAADFAADLRAHLEHRPIAARPPTGLERLRKLVRRHRAVAAGLAAAFVILLAGIASTTWQWRRAVRERGNAVSAAGNAQRLADFFGAIVSSVDPSAHGRDVRFLTVLDEAAPLVERSFEGEPLLEAEVRRAIGRAYLSLGALESAEAHLGPALASLRGAGAGSEALLADTLTLVGRLRKEQGRLDEAQALLEEALAAAAVAGAAGARPALVAEAGLGDVLLVRGRLDEAEPRLVRARDGWAAAGGADAPEALAATNDLATLLAVRGRSEEAIAALSDAAARLDRERGPDDPRTLTARCNLANLLAADNRLEVAAPMADDVLERRRRVLGPRHLDTLRSLTHVAVVRSQQGRLAEADALSLEAATELEERFGAAHEATTSALQVRGMVLRLLGRRKESAETLERAATAWRAVAGDRHPSTLNAIATLGLAKMELGDDSAAAPLLESAVAGFRETTGFGSVLAFQALTNLAALENNRKRFAESERRYAEALEALPAVRDKMAPASLVTLEYNHARLFHDEGKLEEALPRYEAALERARALGFAGAFAVAYCRGGLGECLLDLGRAADAEPHLVASRDALLLIPQAGPERVARAHERLARVCDATARPEEAAAHRAAAEAARRGD